jgi:hypothetical protein
MVPATTTRDVMVQTEASVADAKGDYPGLHPQEETGAQLGQLPPQAFSTQWSKLSETRTDCRLSSAPSPVQTFLPPHSNTKTTALRSTLGDTEEQSGAGKEASLNTMKGDQVPNPAGPGNVEKIIVRQKPKTNSRDCKGSTKSHGVTPSFLLSFRQTLEVGLQGVRLQGSPGVGL